MARSAFRLRHPSDLWTPTGTQPMEVSKKCEWKRGDEARTFGIEAGTGYAAIPSSLTIWHRGHPSRLPFGSLRSAWTGPGRDAGDCFCYEGMADCERERVCLTRTGLLMEGHYQILVARPTSSNTMGTTMALPNPAMPRSIVRAFLSHATCDKPFVEVVAAKLGRQRVQYDNWAFESGANFLAAVRGALSASDCFVLFATKAALHSLWVHFEIDEAEELLRSNAIKSALVLIVDRDTRHTDLPKWMRRALIDHAYGPNAAARLIEHHLNKIRGIEANALFIGRDALLTEISEKLIPAPETPPPHLLISGGLSGIGRRTFLRRALNDFLSLRMGATIYLRPTDGLDALHLALLDELGTLDAKEDLALAIGKFQKADLPERANSIAQLLASAAVGNVAPVIVNDGALTDSGGHYTNEAFAVFEGLRAFPECVVGIVHTRRPVIDESALAGLKAVFFRIPPLDLSSTKLLLTQMLRRSKVEATSDQISELAPYLDGYPPAVNLSVSIASEYGMSVLIADKSGLVDFKIRTFANVLEKLTVSDRQWIILRVLAAEMALSLPGIVATAGGDEASVANDLRRLIDMNLILTFGNVFTIAAPVRSAIQSLKKPFSDAEFTAIAKILKSTFWDGIATLPPVEIIQATIHAVMRSQGGDLSDFKGFVLPSMLYRTAKDYYDRGEQDGWERANKFVEDLVRLDPEHRQGLILLAKTQVRLSEWSQARRTIARIKEKGFPEYHYLTGFTSWKRGHHASAVTEFRAALARGQHAMEIYHGLASCLVRLADFSEAEKVIRQGLRGRRPNSLLLDVAAQIAIIQKNYADAENYIDQLRRIRADADYNFRMATLHNARKQFRAALPLAEAAMNSPRRRFEMEATLIDTLIEVRDFNRASALLDTFDRRQKLGKAKDDVRLGLRCKLNLRQGKWHEADNTWQLIKERNTPVHLALRSEILEQQINDVTISPGARVKAVAELAQVRAAETDPNIGLYAAPESETDSGDSESEGERA